MNQLSEALERNAIIEELRSRISTFIYTDKTHILTRDVILLSHNTVEGIINLLISRYYLGKEIEKTDKNKVNSFWIDILAETAFTKKIDILKKLNILDNNDVAIKALFRINNIRNDLVHYPHLQYKRKDNYLMYKGKHIFKDIEALRMFYSDFDLILNKALNIIKQDE